MLTSNISLIAHLSENNIFDHKKSCFYKEGRINQHQLCTSEQCFVNCEILQPLQCFVKIGSLKSEDNNTATATFMMAQIPKKPFRACLYNGALEAGFTQHTLCTRKLCFVQPMVMVPLNCYVSLEKL